MPQDSTTADADAKAATKTQLNAVASKPIEAASKKLDAAPKWNTRNLGLRLGADLVSAAAAASLIAPAITIIDRSIIENASGRQSLKDSILNSLKNLVIRPQSLLFSKPFALICMVYGGTYLTANTLDTFYSTIKNKPAANVTAGTEKFAASSSANISLSLVKDQAFTRLFGSGGPPRPVPFPSYVLFAVRDSMTIFASFNLPPLLGPVFSEHLGPELQKRVSGQSVAQFVAPASIQILSTPLHLLGLDLYNRTDKGLSWGERWEVVRKNWAVSTLARMSRIIPAFGVGGVVNSKVRRSLQEKL